MVDTRFTLIGKCVVYLVKMPDKVLRNLEKEMKLLVKVRKAVKNKRKTSKKMVQKRGKSSKKLRKGSPEAKAWGRKMARLRA